MYNDIKYWSLLELGKALVWACSDQDPTVTKLALLVSLTACACQLTNFKMLFLNRN